MDIRNKLLKIFNDYSVTQSEDAESVAKQFNFRYSTRTNEWVKEKRIVKGESVSALFKKFIDQYKKNYRYDLAVKHFYQLSDEDIVEMFDELPYFLNTFHGREQYKPNATSFLREKIWKQDYPYKVQRDRSKKATDIYSSTNWDEYINSLPVEQRASAEAYRTIINFDNFKMLISDGGKKD